jgi:hypothetical protein
MRTQLDSLRIVNAAQDEYRRAVLLKFVDLRRNSTMVVGWKSSRREQFRQ